MSRQFERHSTLLLFAMLCEDPKEKENLLDAGSQDPTPYREQLRQYLEEARTYQKGRWTEEASPTPETLERLRSLGYIK